MDTMNDPLTPKKALLQQLGGGGDPSMLPSGNFGAQGQPLAPGHLTAQSIYDTSGQTDAQRGQMASDTSARHARDAAGFAKDQSYLSSLGGGNPAADYQFYKPEGADPSAGNYGGKLVGGLDFDTQQAGNAGIAPGEGMPNTGPAPTLDQPSGPSWSAGANAGKNSGMILGFDTNKLNDPNSGSAAGSKYTAAAKAFSGGLKQDVGVSRGGLDNMLNYVKANGFKDAKVVGDDKIDFGDGNGPVDVIGSDGSIRFQNTTDNPVWESQYGGGGGGSTDGGAAGAASGGGVAGPAAAGGGSDLLSGDPLAAIRAAIGQYGGQSSHLQQLLGQLRG